MFLFLDKTIQMFSKRNSNKNYKHLPFINIACFISESLVLLRRGTDPGDPYSYTISDVDTDDTGLYSCLAGNILGETVHTAYLLVNNCNMLGHKMLICQLHILTKSQSFSNLEGFIKTFDLERGFFTVKIIFFHLLICLTIQCYIQCSFLHNCFFNLHQFTINWMNSFMRKLSTRL